MTITGLLDEKAIVQEQIVFLRNSDIFTTTQREVTTVTEEFNGTGLAYSFTVAHLNLKNVRTVTVGGVAQTFGTHYTVNYSTGVITFVTAPGAGTNNVDITYDYGSDHIFGDFPRTDLSISKYPRIAVAITSGRTEEMSLGAADNITDYLISITVFADGVGELNDYIKTIRQKYLENKKNFYYLVFVTPAARGPTFHDPNRADKIEQTNLDLRAPFNVETVS